MPARVKFGNLNLNAAAYLIHAHADPSGTHPKLADVFVYVFARQPNNDKAPLADPTLLTNARTLTIYWAGDANPTHEFKNIHLLGTLGASRTQSSRDVLLKFGYEYDKAGIPGWISGGGNDVNVALHYPASHDTAANYLSPHAPAGGDHHRLEVVGQELNHIAGDTWKVAPGNRRLLAFDASTESGIAGLAGGKSPVPAPSRLTMIGFRDNRCRVFNTLLEQDRQIRANVNANPQCELKLTMPTGGEATSIPLAGVAKSRLAYVEHRNFWLQDVWGTEPWDAPLAPAQPVIQLPRLRVGTIGDVIRLQSRALIAADQEDASDIGLEAVVMIPGAGLAGTLAAVRA